MDFVCLEKNVIVELDGSQHARDYEYDVQRTEFLSSHGFCVLRFWNNQVIESLCEVVEKINRTLSSSSSSSEQ